MCVCIGDNTLKIKEKEKVKCNRCSSEHVVSHGYVPTVKKGKRKRYKCQNCAHTFYVDDD
jgi:transposase-like protein